MSLQKVHVLEDVVSKFEVQMFTKKEVKFGKAQNEQFLCSRSRSSKGQGHQCMCLQKSHVPENVVSKLEEQMFTNKEVTAGKYSKCSKYDL